PQEWDNVVAATKVQNGGLIGPEQAFHGFEVHALAGHIRRLLVLIVDLEEARGLAAGFGNRLLAVGFGGLQYLCGTAAGLRNNPVGIGLRFVPGTLEIDTGGLHITQRIENLRGRVDLLQLHLRYLHAGVVTVQDLLHQVLHVRLDALTGNGRDLLAVGAADHLAHGAFGDRFHRTVRLLNVEKVIGSAGGLDDPKHREIDVDDVL